MSNQQGFSAVAGLRSLVNLLNHYARSTMEKYKYLTQRGKKKSYTMSEIDPSRTHLNKNYGPERDMSEMEFIERRLEGVYVHGNAKQNLLVDWVIDLPRLEQYEGREDEFFQHVYDFCAALYGEKNVVCAYVHNDEHTPHMHFAFLPIVDDEKRGEKLSRKEVNGVVIRKTVDGKEVETVSTKDFSKRFHTMIEKYVREKMGFEVAGLQLTEEQKQARKIKKNMTVPELKRNTEELERLEGQTRAIRDSLEEIEERDIKPGFMNTVKFDDVKEVIAAKEKALAEQVADNACYDDALTSARQVNRKLESKIYGLVEIIKSLIRQLSRGLKTPEERNEDLKREAARQLLRIPALGAEEESHEYAREAPSQKMSRNRAPERTKPRKTR